jgi:hypothetical protein
MADANNPFEAIFNDDANGTPGSAITAPFISSQPSAPAPSAAPTEPPGANPFETIFAADESAQEAQAESGPSPGAGFRSTERVVIPAMVGMAAAGAGAETGGSIGAAAGALFGGIGAVPGGIVGSIIGAVVGGVAGSVVTDKAQEFAASPLPDSWKDVLGGTEEQQQRDIKYHPTETFIGGMVPYMLTMRPGGFGASSLPQNATSLQKIASSPVTSHLFGGAVMGGMELGNQVAAGQAPDWRNVAIATGVGVIFNKPNRVGQRLNNIGEAAAARVGARINFGEPRTTPDNAAAPAAEAASDITVAQAGDANVMGPGITEDVFMGSHEPSPEAAMNNRNAARNETAVLAPQADAVADVHATARRLEPETFAEYDALDQQRTDLRTHIAQLANPVDEDIAAATARRDAAQAQLDEHLAARGGYAAGPAARRLRAQVRDAQGDVDDMTQRREQFDAGQGRDTPEMTALREQLMATDIAMRDLAPQVSSAYRRAAEHGGSEIIEPEAPATAPAQPAPPDEVRTPGEQEPTPGGPVTASVEEQGAEIAQDVARQLIAAGRSPAEAEASGQLIASHYRTRAARFGGALGTPLELYRAQAPAIRGVGAAARAIEPAQTEGLPRTLVPDEPSENQTELFQRQIGPVPAERKAAHLAAAKDFEDKLRAEFGDDFTIETEQASGGSTYVTVRQRLKNKNGSYKKARGEAPVGRTGFKLRIADHGSYYGSTISVDPASGNSIEQALALFRYVAKRSDEAPAFNVSNIDPGSGETKIAPATYERDSETNPIKYRRDDLRPVPERTLYQPAYHGSPHIFDRFSTEKIGTGEGAQAYGHGLYFAGKKQVADWYREQLAGRQQVKFDGKYLRELSQDHILDLARRAGVENASASDVRDVLAVARDSVLGSDDARSDLREYAKIERLNASEASDESIKLDHARHANIAEAFAASDLIKNEKPGRLYHVDVPEPHELMDWDKPLSEQPEGVREKLAKAGEFADKPLLPTDTGAQIYNKMGSPQQASEALKWAGIPGHQYIGHESQSTNYVIYDDSRVPITNYEQGKRGSITFAAGRKPIIKLFADANASTFIHETGHQWLEEMLRDASHAAAPDAVKADTATVRKWLGMTEDQASPVTRQHEKFARGFEQYMREGVAPSAGLARVFAQFKSWLSSIYASIKGLGTPINEDIRSVFDRLIAEEPSRTVVAPERATPESPVDIHEREAATVEPHEAEPAMDRIIAERDRYLAEQPPEVLNEITAAETEQQAADAAAAADAGTEGGASEPGPAEVGAAGGEPGVEPAGGAGGGEHGEVVGGGNEARPAGPGLAGERGPADAGLRGERSEPAGAARANPLNPSPSALLGAAESPFLDKAGNIRVENLTTSAEVAQAIHDAADTNNGFIDQRRELTDGEVLDLADALGMDVAQLSKRKLGEAFNAEQIVAARKLLIQSATRVSELMKAAAIGSDQDVLAYAEARDRHVMIQGQVAGITAEAGRALRAFRSLAGQETATVIDQFLRTATGKTLFQLREEAKLGAKLDTPAKVSKMLRDAQKRDFGRMILEYWINGLVSGPRTQVTNAIGNTLMSLQSAGPETAMAALIGKVRSAAGREGTRVRMGEVGAQLRAAGQSLPVATKAALDAIRTGRGIALPGEEISALPYQPGSELAHTAFLDETMTADRIMPELFGTVRGLTDGLVAIGKLAAGGGDAQAPLLHLRFSPLGAIPDIAIRGTTVVPLGTTLRAPTRMLAAGDSFFRAANYSMAKARISYRQAAEEGLTGTDLHARIGDLYQNPSSEMMELSRSNASELTFMANRSEFVTTLGRLSNLNIIGLPLLKFIAPFINTPSNIIEQAAMHRTPFGLVSPEIRADLAGKNGNIAQDTATAKMLLGSAYAISFGGLAARGLLSGSGPADPEQTALWMLAGNQPHSARIGDMWYDLRALGPVGMLAGISADMLDVAHAAETGDVAAAGAAVLHAFMQNIFDASFMTGPADLIQALEDHGRYGQPYLRNFAASFVPFSGLMGQATRSTDPYTRQARTVIDTIKQKIPGLSETLMPRRDVWGNEIPAGTALGPSFLSAIYTQQVSHDPVNQALLSAGYWPGPPDRKIRGVLLTDEQYDQYSQYAGRMAKSRLDTMVRSPAWASWPPEVRHEVVKETFAQSRETARGAIMAKWPDIVVKAVQQKLAPLKGASE